MEHPSVVLDCLERAKVSLRGLAAAAEPSEFSERVGFALSTKEYPC